MSPEEIARIEEAQKTISLRMHLGLCCDCGRVLNRRRFEVWYCSLCEPLPRCQSCNRHVAIGVDRCASCEAEP